MDEEFTSGYNEPCGRCSAVDWGVSDEGRFYCRSCHNVIERTKEVQDPSFTAGSSRITTISKGTRKKTKREHGRQWVVCEGFQFVLQHQAEALVAMGVCPQFKDGVLCHFWRRYLQKTQQAYTKDPVCTGRFSVAIDSDSAPESVVLSEQSWQSGPTSDHEWARGSGSGYSSDGASSVCSGSLDAIAYVSPRERGPHHVMSMPRTLALCHLALLWVREALTLADLLRFVSEKHVPYVNLYEDFPEEMTLFGRDAQIFRVESIPSYRRVQKEALQLAQILELPCFPPISQHCLLHPALLSLRYLAELNLPDELHHWVVTVMEQSNMGEDAFLTFDPVRQRPTLLSYDLQATALITVTMKLLFKLDDQMEWTLSNKADGQNEKNKTHSDTRSFSLRRWYAAVQRALSQAREREEQDLVRRQWKSCKPIIPSQKDKNVVLKRKRVVEQLQKSFQKLSGPSPDPLPSAPSSFRFQWGEGDGADGPSLHQDRLNCILKKQGGAHRLANRKYWHSALRSCNPRVCKDHFSELEPTLPRMYVWLLDFFSFLLGVKRSCVHEEVLKVERRFLKSKPQPKARKKPSNPTSKQTRKTRYK